MLFNGQTIREHAKDGPYTVSTVRLYDDNDIALQADEAFDVLDTVAYQADQFGSGNSVYLPIILKDN